MRWVKYSSLNVVLGSLWVVLESKVTGSNTESVPKDGILLTERASMGCVHSKKYYDNEINTKFRTTSPPYIYGAL